jgi:hypothetical protein
MQFPVELETSEGLLSKCMSQIGQTILATVTVDSLHRLYLASVIVMVVASIPCCFNASSCNDDVLVTSHCNAEISPSVLSSIMGRK